MSFDPFVAESPRLRYASRAAAEILNLYIHSAIPSPELYERLRAVILEAMTLAESDLKGMRIEVNRN